MKIFEKELKQFKHLAGLNEEKEEKNCKNLIFHAPEDTKSTPSNSFKIFLGGTIDMDDSTGKAASRDWQKELENKVKETKFDKQVTIFNPRRDEWEETDKFMNEQVNWELDHQDKCDLMILNLGEKSKSPISLLELGIHCQDVPQKLVVFCKEGFYRYQNVRIVCERYNIPIIHSNDTDDIINEVIKRIKE